MSHAREARRVRVLYLPEPHVDSSTIVALIAPNHDLAIFDSSVPLAAQFAEVEVVLDSGGSVGSREMLDAAGSVRLWQIVGSGIDHFDLESWSAAGIAVAHTPGSASAESLAEVALMFMLMLVRRYPEANANLKAGVMGLPPGAELAGRSIGLVGFGASAKALARIVRPLGMRIAASDIRTVSLEEQREFGLEWVATPNELDVLVAQSDFLSLHLHLTGATRRIVDRRRIGLMRPGAHLINVARGALVDEEALAEALGAGRLGGAGLDVFEKEPMDGVGRRLVGLPNVVATPHNAANTPEALRRRAEMCLENVNRIANGLAPQYLVG
jgi:phosphoglycerate dehydrogenase-like enzyme